MLYHIDYFSKRMNIDVNNPMVITLFTVKFHKNENNNKQYNCNDKASNLYFSIKLKFNFLRT